MHKCKRTHFKLRELFTLRAGAWLLAWLIGIITLIATVGLLATSGWFISAAAIAGIVTSGAALTFDFFRPAAMIRAFAIIRTAGRYGERLASHHAVLALLKDLRCRFFAAIAKNKLHHTRELVQSDQVMHRLITDIEQLDELPLRYWAPWIWAQSLTLIFLLFVWIFAPTLIAFTAPILLCASLFIPMLGMYFGCQLAKKITVMAEQRRQKLLQPLRALTSLLLWQKWQDFSHQFIQTSDKFSALQRSQQRLANGLVALQQSALTLTILVIMYKGFALIDSGSLSIPMLLAFILAIFGLAEVITPLATNFTALGFAIASRDRLNPLLSDTLKNEKPNSLPPIPRDSLTLNVEQLSVKYPEAIQGINNINLALKSGDILLINGPSGGGKSTLLNALAGEVEPRQGKILLNNRPLTQWSMQSHFAYLAQQLDIFDLSLADNLRLGKAEATDAELLQVLEAVDLANWTQAQPNGLDTLLGEYGAAVSGGQARRIALARLLLTPKSILLLDEPFAGLDPKTISHIMTELRQRLKNGILIIVSHQAVFMDNADDIKVLSI